MSMDRYSNVEPVLMESVGIRDINLNNDLLDEALNLDIKYLDNIDDRDLTKYIAVLAQYGIFLQLTYNKHNLLKKRISRTLDLRLYRVAKDNNLLKKGTKSERKMEVMSMDSVSAALQSKLDVVTEKITLLEGVAKTIDFYTNALKKDMNRRRLEFGSND